MICLKCKESKEDICFYVSKGKISSSCKVCERKRKLDFYKDNHVEINKRKTFRNAQKLELIIEYKKSGCAICDEKEICCIDFHHVNPEDKKFKLANYADYGIKTIAQEIDKCVLLCSNCHRKVHAGIVSIQGKL